MDRDLAGYGENPPIPKWPTPSGRAGRLALQFVINYEEGGENCILNGDDQSEWLLSEIVGATPYKGVRHMNMESLYEYGSRVGFWRLHRLFTERELPCTVFAVAKALELNPKAGEAMVQAGWEVASHGYRWIDYQYVSEDLEREHIRKAIEIHKEVIGTRPLGIYQGKPSPNTRRLIVEEGGFEYDADSYADELPYWMKVAGKSHLVVPYTLDANDMRFATAQGFNSGDQFFCYLKDAFDFLYKEGERYPRMLSVGLHCRLVARPGRALALERFLDYVKQFDDVWITTRLNIARLWKEQFPAD
ncbi:MAG: allantoinase PuuE [Proteobacteria bacterium]|nr:allantoinase PuuE [Pseudomonadota bacterium]